MGEGKILQFPGPGKKDRPGKSKRRGATPKTDGDIFGSTPAQVNRRADPYIARIGEQDEGENRQEQATRLNRPQVDELLYFMADLIKGDPRRANNLSNTELRQKIMRTWPDSQLVDTVNDLDVKSCQAEPAKCNALIGELKDRGIIGRRRPPTQSV